MSDSDLVMAMPRRELYKVSGFTRAIDYAVLESLDGEHWFSAPGILRDNPDAKEVRLGLIALRSAESDQVLIEERGVLLHAAPIPPEAAQFGAGLRALRELARAAAGQLLGCEVGVIELLGYLNDDALAECRDAFILVYQAQVRADLAAPEGMSWVGLDHLHEVALDPVSSLVTPVVERKIAKKHD